MALVSPSCRAYIATESFIYFYILENLKYKANKDRKDNITNMAFFGRNNYEFELSQFDKYQRSFLDFSANLKRTLVFVKHKSNFFM